MLQCDPFTEDPGISWYAIFLDLLFVCGIVVNGYVVYCIIYLSPKNMSSYKWYLLWHQIFTAFTDVSINLIAKPVIFSPFQMGYISSNFRGIIPSHYMATMSITALLISWVTIEHLFVFRYLTIIRTLKFPFHYKIRLFLTYLLAMISGVAFYFSYSDMAPILKDMHKHFSCVDTYLLKITGFIVYDEWILFRNVAPTSSMACALVLLDSGYCVHASLKNILASSMSLHLKRLQKKFLIQLIFQVSVPFAIVIFPFSMHTIIVYLKLFSFGRTITHFLMISMSSFSIVGGIVLLVLNPVYWPRMDWFRRKKAIAIIPSKQPKPFVPLGKAADQRRTKLHLSFTQLTSLSTSNRLIEMEELPIFAYSPMF